MRCSFCGIHESMAGKLISTPVTANCFICDKCVDMCGDILDQDFMTATDKLLQDIRAKKG